MPREARTDRVGGCCRRHPGAVMGNASSRRGRRAKDAGRCPWSLGFLPVHARVSEISRETEEKGESSRRKMAPETSCGGEPSSRSEEDVYRGRAHAKQRRPMLCIKLQAASCKLQAASCKLQASNTKQQPPSIQHQASSIKLRAPSINHQEQARSSTRAQHHRLPQP